jgi:hypothetical protein
MSSDTIAFTTVVYNNYDVLADFMKSLKDQINENFHLYIADASSQKKRIEYPGVPYTVIPCKNLGYAHGINLGLKAALKAGYTKFCVINDDVFFEKNLLSEMEFAFTRHPSSLFGGLIYYARGHEYHKKRYADDELGQVIWYGGGVVDWNHALTHHRGVDEVDLGQDHLEEKTEFITGCMMCFDKSVIDTIGFWDEDYFLYYEDADYCERAKQKKLSLFYVPTLRIWHKNAQSTDGAGSKIHVRYQEKSQVRYALKYAPLRTKFHILWNYIKNRYT